MGEVMIRKLILGIFFMNILTYADEHFPFIGLSLGYQTLTPTNFESTNHTAIGLQIGSQSLNWRTTFGIAYEKSYKSADMEVDYIPFDTLFGTPKIRPYLGLNINYFHYSNSQLQEGNGYSFGGNAGVIIYADDRVDIDIGYRYNKTRQINGLDTLRGPILSVHYFY